MQHQDFNAAIIFSAITYLLLLLSS